MELYSMEKPPMVETIKKGEHSGFEFFILWFSSHPNAYIKIPKNHPFYKKDYLDEMPLDRSWEVDYEVEGNIYENKDLLDYIEKDQKTK